MYVSLGNNVPYPLPTPAVGTSRQPGFLPLEICVIHAWKSSSGCMNVWVSLLHTHTLWLEMGMDSFCVISILSMNMCNAFPLGKGQPDLGDVHFHSLLTLPLKHGYMMADCHICDHWVPLVPKVENGSCSSAVILYAVISRSKVLAWFWY